MAVEQLILRAVGQFIGGSELIAAARAVGDLDAATARSSATMAAQAAVATNVASAQSRLAVATQAAARTTLDADGAYRALADSSTRAGIASGILTTRQNEYA